MPIFDTHCHYNLEPLFSNWPAHLQKAQEHEVTDAAIIGVDVPSSKLAIEIATHTPKLYPVVGCHPTHYQEILEQAQTASLATITDDIHQLIDTEKNELIKLLSANSGLIKAIGETGLDYFRLPDGSLADKIKSYQRAAFEMQVKLAAQHELPLVIHVRDQNEDAYWDTLKILESEKFSQPFVLHCVSGPTAFIQRAIELGGYLGLGGNLTYKNSQHFRELVLFSPPSRRLFETDAPFLPPVPYRGQICEPWMISQTTNYLVTELDCDSNQIYQNSLNFFNLAEGN